MSKHYRSSQTGVRPDACEPTGANQTRHSPIRMHSVVHWGPLSPI